MKVVLVLGLAIAAHGPLACAAAAHDHGTVKANVAVDGDRLTVLLEAPLDALVGFERAPRSPAERRTAENVLNRMRKADALIVPAAAAGCRLAQAHVDAPVLQGASSGGGEHAELEAEYAFKCTTPAQLVSLELGLFDAFKRVRRIEVQVAGRAKQSRVTLTRPARTVHLLP